jgi:hypothetical protein
MKGKGHSYFYRTRTFAQNVNHLIIGIIEKFLVAKAANPWIF